jgi:hypothetical protein
MKKIVVDESERFTIIFNFWEQYEDIEKFASVLKRKLKAKVLRVTDGPDSRIWEMSLEGIEFLLINSDPYGNYLRADTQPAVELLKKYLPRIQMIFEES